MLEKLSDYQSQLHHIDDQLADSATMKDMNLYKKLTQERSHLQPVVDALVRLQTITDQIADAKELLREETDSEMIALTKEELDELESAFEQTTHKVKLLLIPPDPLAGKDIIMEIRAGTGGEEAALFAADLYRMYSHYADSRSWKMDILSSNETGIGGYKELIISISGKDVYASLQYESGVHRVQRVPETESGGRIHTSAVTVAVLAEAEETDIEIRTEDLRVDVMRSSGPGGQSVNTTDSAVRMTHIPTGIVVICQDEKSQIKNRAKALRVLRSRLFEMEEEKKAKERAENRKSQVGSGDRSERIRTYNFPQNRLTDHRINLTLYKLDLIMAGSLDEVIEPLKIASGEAALAEA
ncbi:MAG: peptide chain release factor 1 [Sphaerochaeta sp.]